MNKTFTKFKSRLLAAAALAILAVAPAFAQINFIEGPVANGTSGSNRAPSGAADFQRTATIYLGSDFPGLMTGPINSVGFSIAQGALTAATGTIKIYMVNTTDATYNRGTTWSSIISTPSAMTLVYNGPLTIPTAVGPFSVTLQTPFAYTGGNFYFAYEWAATTKSTASAIYNANNSLANSLVTMPATTLAGTDMLTNSSAFRPVLRLGVPAPPNDMDVRAIFVQGKAARNGGKPQVIQALVKNNGANTLLNRTITLNISGANTFTSSVVLGTLAPGQDSIVSFAPFAPANIGNNNFAEVTVAADDVLTNNSKDANIVVTAGTIGYGQYPTAPNGAPTIQTALAGLFPTTAPTPATRNANFLSRFMANGVTTVNTVRAYVPGDLFNPVVNTPGTIVYGVVFDAAGVEIARSANVTLAAADVDKLVNFTLTTPAVIQNNQVYYVGMGLPAQPTKTANVFAMGAQSEQNGAVRPGAFFVSPVSTTASVPVEYGDDIRFVIEADITAVTGLKEELNAKAVNVYPNPSKGLFNVSAKDMKGNNLTLEVRDLQGKLVYSAKTSKADATVNLKNVASGVYMLTVTSESQVAVKRLIVE